MENQIAKLDVEFRPFANANLCPLAHSNDRTSAQCIALDTEAPFSLLVIVEKTQNHPDRLSPDTDASSAQGSAERPAVTLRLRVEHPQTAPALPTGPVRPATAIFLWTLHTVTGR